jgi:hypothetical protein
MKLRIASGVIVAGLACGVYAWLVLSAFARPGITTAAFSAAYQYSGGQITGGGTILRKSVTFQFDATSDTRGISGDCDVVEGRTRIDCVSFTSLAVVGTHATLQGTARQNGVMTSFRIDMDDLGEPAIGRDRFAITTGTGYSRSGALTSGNVQIH